MPGVLGPEFGQQGEGGHEADQGDRHVDQEHPAPPVVGEQPAAENGADRHGQEVPGPEIPTAFGRSSLENSTVSEEIAITITPAPASPSTTRAAMNSVTVVEYAHPAEPTAKSASEIRKTLLWP